VDVALFPKDNMRGLSSAMSSILCVFYIGLNV